MLDTGPRSATGVRNFDKPARYQILRWLRYAHAPWNNRRCLGDRGQLAVLELGASAISRLMRMRNKINPPIFGISTEIISGFQQTDFTKDFGDFSRISRKISGFQRRFPDFAKDFRFHERFQVKCTRFRGVADPSGQTLKRLSVWPARLYPCIVGYRVVGRRYPYRYRLQVLTTHLSYTAGGSRTGLPSPDTEHTCVIITYGACARGGGRRPGFRG